MLTSERSAAFALQTRVQILPGVGVTPRTSWILATCEERCLPVQPSITMSVKRPDQLVATMIRALFVLSLIVAVASAFVAPVNHAAGESMIHRPVFRLKIGESKQVQSWGLEKVVGLQGTIRRGVLVSRWR